MEKEKIKFEDLGLSENILRALKDYGYENPTPIQSKTIPSIMEGKDVLGLSKTGTGKTASFGLPLIENIDCKLNKVQAIILCPTRELALQVTRRIKKIYKVSRKYKMLSNLWWRSYWKTNKRFKKRCKDNSPEHLVE